MRSFRVGRLGVEVFVSVMIGRIFLGIVGNEIIIIVKNRKFFFIKIISKLMDFIIFKKY